MELTARLVTELDMMLIFEWANDPITRQMSFNQNTITLQAHQQWFEATITDPKQCFLIIEKDNVPVGQVRLNGNGVIGVSIAPNSRGQRLGTPVLRKGVDYFLKHTLHKIIIAYIKLENKASVKIFERVGFQLFQQTTIQDSPSLEYHYTVQVDN